MSFTIKEKTLAKKDLIALYNISYPTLRRWLRRAGLQVFIGRKKLKVGELVTIFQHLGLPRLARSAAQRLKEMFFQVKGLLSDEIRYREQHNSALPKIKQDLLEKSTEEQDHPPVYKLDKAPKTSPLFIWDALCRLTCAAIKVRGLIGRQKEEKKLTKIKQLEKYSPASKKLLSSTAKAA